jgi:hypothetical protein
MCRRWGQNHKEIWRGSWITGLKANAMIVFREYGTKFQELTEGGNCVEQLDNH